MLWWHHWLKGHEFEQALVVGDGQGSLVCWSSWGCKESDMTEGLNRTEWISNLERFFFFFGHKLIYCRHCSSPSNHFESLRWYTLGFVQSKHILSVDGKSQHYWKFPKLISKRKNSYRGMVIPYDHTQDHTFASLVF